MQHVQHVRDCGAQLFIISRKGGTLLAINDFIYRSNLKRFGPLGDKVYWECIQNRSKKCRSRLKTIGDDLYVTNDVHNHAGDRERIELARRSGRHAAILLKTGTWLEDNLTFVPNRRGGLNLIYKGYLYTAERRYHSTINWVCNKNSNTSIRCPARCVTADFTIIRKHHHKSYTIINNYRYVISSQSTNTYYLKCANFRKSCRARAIIHRTKFAQYITSRRGTQLVFFKHNTYTPNSKLKPYTRSRDWKCSMYHKAKCKARLVTKFTTIGDIIHETSTFHTHQPMYPDTKPFL